MPIVADASVAIRGDMSGFSADLRRAEGETRTFQSRISSLLSPKGLLGAGALFGLGSTLPTLTRQLIGFAGDAAAAYGELEQTVRTIDNVFGESADQIREWGETAADTAGMSQQTFMSSAAVMGQTLLNMGFEQEEAAERTTQLLQRAADLAIAFGKRPQDALLAITAAMRGERDTIEKFGVAIKQVDVNARIAALGLDASTAAAKKNAEAVAVVDLLLDQSEETAGRFAESQDDIAVKMAQTNARWDDFVAKDVGGAVASIQLGFFKVADAVGGATEGVGTFFDNMFNREKLEQMEMLGERLGIPFSDMRRHIQVAAEASGRTWEDQLSFMVAMTVEMSSEVRQELNHTINTIPAIIEKGGPRILSAAEEALADPIIVAMLGGKEEAERIAGETPGGIAQALLDAQFVVKDAAAELVSVEEEALRPMQERNQIIGFLSSKALADALASNKPAVAQRALELKEAAEARLAELQGAAFYHGLATAQSYAAGMNAGYGFVYNAASGLASATRNQIGINSEPEDPNSPLRGITKWGGNIVKTIADGIYGELGTGSAAAAALAGALVPSVSGMGAAGTASSGGTTIQNYLVVEGVPKQIRDRDEMWAAFRQMHEDF